MHERIQGQVYLGFLTFVHVPKPEVHHARCRVCTPLLLSGLSAILLSAGGQGQRTNSHLSTPEVAMNTDPRYLEDPLKKPQVGEVYEVTLSTWAYGGDAMGRLPDGRAVFVPYTLPGEHVRVRLTEVKTHYARGVVETILQPSPDRVPPRCPHYGVCGGCHYQHVHYAAQLTAKTAIVRDQLERIGKLYGVLVYPTVPSPRPWHYRNHLRFHVTQDGRLGFQKAMSNETLPIETCLLADEAIAEVWPQIRLEAPETITQVHVRSAADGEVMVVLEGTASKPPEEIVVESGVSVVYLGPEPQDVYVLAGRSYLVQEVKGRLFRVSAASFFQTNLAVAEGMIDHILENLPLTGEETLLELYAGVGLFTAFLAPRVRRVIAVEAAPSACEDFAVNLDEFNHVELYEAPVEDVLPYLRQRQERIDVALLDPPRTGLSKVALQGLVDLAPRRIVYVSCHPTTLARDAHQLHEHGYRLVRITPFDMFPQTYHIETVSFWEKAK